MKMIQSVKKVILLFLVLVLTGVKPATSQHIIDQVLAVVGDKKILLSDIEQEQLRLKMQGVVAEGDIKCNVFEEMLVHKILLHYAEIDSIEVSAGMVENEMERRLKYFVNQIGSEAALEKYFSKSIFQIKSDLRLNIKESLLAQKMQESIVSNVTVTPSEVNKFFKNIPNDSLPTIPEQYEYRQIVLYPPASSDAKLAVRDQLLSLRERVLKGERFGTLAVAYSEDRASASRGGELGFRSRDELVKAFADVAFNLREGQVSQIVETEYGFHIIQMIERRDEQVNVRHILMKPSFSQEEMIKSQNRLDSIANLIKTDSLTFVRAAQYNSEDKKTRLSGGLVINQNTNTSLFEREHLPPADFYAIRNLKIGEISAPFESRDEHANVIYKIITITRIVPEHKANLNDDYAIIQNMTKMNKQNEVFLNWVQSRLDKTYIRIDPSYRNCQFDMQGWVK